MAFVKPKAFGNYLDIRMQMTGHIEANTKMLKTAKAMGGTPMLNTLRRATLLVVRDAKKEAPVDQGPLRASIIPEIRSEGRSMVGIVGSNRVYAPFQEYGTGVFAGHSPYAPPVAALAGWAGRHRTTGYLASRAIAAAGGTRGRAFLQKGYLQNKDAIVKMIEDMVKGVVNE